MSAVQKIGSFFCLGALLCALSACSGGENQSTPQGESADAPQTVEETQVEASAPLAFVTPGGVTVALNENMEDALSDLGDPLSYFESASCAFDGLDKQYTYSGFEITTRPEEDGDYVNSILLTDDSAATAEGVYIGCTPEQVSAAYGEGEETAGGLKYTRGDTALSFIIEDGKVVSIEYLPAA